VKFNRNSILCLSESGHGVVTAGGVTAWQELALYLISRFCGTTQARETAKVYLLSGHEGGQLQFAAMNRRINGTDKTVSDCQAWIAHNYTEANPVKVMAGRAGLSARTFFRRFHAATGRSPIDYVQALRIEEAKQMLETGRVPLDDIGAAVGYEDPASFRRVFRKLAGVSPAVYRKRVSAIAPAK
jgi:transcriptional regulator GlxA family with amidase domain